MNKITFFTILFLISGMIYGQSPQILIKKGDRAFENEAYFAAAQYYHAALNPEKSKNSTLDKEASIFPYSSKPNPNMKFEGDEYADVVEKLAGSLFLYRDYHKSLPWVKQAVTLKPTLENGIRYITVLRNLMQYERALVEINDLESNFSPSDAQKQIIRKLKNSCVFGLEARNYPGPFRVDTLDSIYNFTGASNFGLQYVDGMLVFTTTRAIKGKLSDNTPQMHQIVYTDIDHGTLSPIKSDFQGHIASPSFAKYGSRVYFSAKGSKDTAVAIYIAYIEGPEDIWKPVKLSDMVNLPEVNNHYPFVHPDGKTLFFCSDREDGYGGMDIYSVLLDADGLPTGNVKNLGSKINSEGDEVSPFLNTSTGVFYFSSDGHIGMGGLDVFSIDWEKRHSDTPKNLGYPVNSGLDDMYPFIWMEIPERHVFISSDRSENCCLEQYYFVLGSLHGRGHTIDNEGNPLKDVEVILIDSVTNKELDRTVSNDSGIYHFPLSTDRKYKVRVPAGNYFPAEEYFHSFGDYFIDTIDIPDLILIPVEINKPIVINNILYDYNMATLRPESKEELNKLYAIFEQFPNLKVEIRSHTDSVGSHEYNMDLSHRRSQSVVDYLIEIGFKKYHIRAKGFGKTMPLVPNSNPNGSDNPENRQVNRRTEFVILEK
jgi:OmpA-OmpF porin, OOP family